MRGPLSIKPTRLFKDAVRGFAEHDDLTLAASISYYTALSLAPLLVLVLWIAASISPGAKIELVHQVALVAGPDAGEAVNAIVTAASRRPSLGSVAGVFGVAILVVAASAVFVQLQTALNLIWADRDDCERRSNAFLLWLRRRLLAMGILAAFAFLLIVSLVVSAMLAVLLPWHGPILDIVNQIVSLVVFALLFAGLFQLLPDKRVGWRDATAGAIVTAVLFAAGKFAIEEYLAHSGIAGSYGPAGSLAVILVWVYYSASIFLFGAECVRVFAAFCRDTPGACAETIQDSQSRSNEPN
ncbi:MAG TPA: YihY/virulence factor BrkB family protein [Rudaea sp.]|nr:YihY/virulence factor BrkB family protein [Rudaea sp.]